MLKVEELQKKYTVFNRKISAGAVNRQCASE